MNVLSCVMEWRSAVYRRSWSTPGECLSKVNIGLHFIWINYRMCPVNDSLETFTKCRALENYNAPNLSSDKRRKVKFFCKKLFIIKNFKSLYVARKQLGILQIRLLIRILRTWCSRKQKFLVIDIP
jgi:hypothetical protein